MYQIIAALCHVSDYRNANAHVSNMYQALSPTNSEFELHAPSRNSKNSGKGS